MRLSTCVYIGMCVCLCLCKYMCVCVWCVCMRTRVGPLTMSILSNTNVVFLCCLLFPVSPVEFKKCQSPMSLYYLSQYRGRYRISERGGGRVTVKY